jgi:hypothetical protein
MYLLLFIIPILLLKIDKEMWRSGREVFMLLKIDKEIWRSRERGVHVAENRQGGD